MGLRAAGGRGGRGVSTMSIPPAPPAPAPGLTGCIRERRTALVRHFVRQEIVRFAEIEAREHAGSSAPTTRTRAPRRVRRGPLGVSMKARTLAGPTVTTKRRCEPSSAAIFPVAARDGPGPSSISVMRGRYTASSCGSGMVNASPTRQFGAAAIASATRTKARPSTDQRGG